MALVGDGITDDTAAMNALLSSAVSSNSAARIPSGMFKVNPCALSYAGLTDEATVVRGRSDIVGDGAASSIIKSAVAGQFALTVEGAPGVAAHSYAVVERLGFGREPAGAYGLKLKNLAYVSLRDTIFQGLDVGLELESVLSSSFSNLSTKWGGIGLVLKKGTGFSGVNGVTFSECSWGGLSVLGVQGFEFSTNILFDGCEIEGCGAQGNVWRGGAVLTFTGAEGGVGATFRNCYFEGNKGAFDVQLVNNGPNYITHIFEGCNFNRVSATDFVTNNIQSFGKNRIVLIGNSFNHYGNYGPSSTRKYVNGDANMIVTCIGNEFADAAEKGGLVNL